MIRDEQHFICSESKIFQDFVHVALDPQFKSRNTTKNIIYKQYNEGKLKLIHIISNLKCKVALTSVVWTSPNKFSYK